MINTFVPFRGMGVFFYMNYINALKRTRMIVTVFREGRKGESFPA
ncbi:hypothetical protein M036_19220 [Bacillus subtilis TO-A]|nr:hypothetical protein BSn5_09765 [Bacillus subtilis BSn5]AII38178.1 hypothetical protein M036_19220 [Bacillus subtilis TO-A]EXF55512.1 hypothetical protein Y647_01860 [Bacillus subtilis QH-1]